MEMSYLRDNQQPDENANMQSEAEYLQDAYWSCESSFSSARHRAWGFRKCGKFFEVASDYGQDMVVRIRNARSES